MAKTLLSMLLMLLAAMNVYAADAASMIATTDGHAFDSLTPEDIERLSAPDKAAYQIWDGQHHTEQSSTYQQSEGPNTMDISSDFSM